MLKLFTPTLRISLGLVSLTISLILCGYMFGLVPDESRAELNARARIAEALAMQLSAAVARNDLVVIQDTLSSVEKRNTAVLSMALRRANGSVLFASRDHDIHWIEPHDQKSTATHVQVPLLNGDQPWGKIEIAFQPLESGELFAGIPYALAILIAFLSVLGLAGYYFILGRALRELDPSGVIPERVQVAFDSLAEGVMILDEQETVLLANSSFAKAINETPKSLFGTSICDLKWRQWNDGDDVDDHPWRVAMRDKHSVTAVNMGLRTVSGDLRNFTVNATCILDGNSKVSGAIATFDDVTELARKNEDLIRAVQQLEETEEEISHRNRQLQYLANHDPLSGCLNRRAFFEEVETRLAHAQRDKTELACLMVDLDHFKQVNDRFGHAVGDQVIAGVADILKTSCREDDLAGRYGGEEFCLVLVDMDQEQSKRVAEQIRQDITNASPVWLPPGEIVTSSIGIAMKVGDYTSSSATDMVDRADQALYAAKEGGRDQVVTWDETEQPAKSHPAKQSPLRQSSNLAKEAVADALHPPAAAQSEPSQEEQSFDNPQLSLNSGSASLKQLPARIVLIDRISQSIARAERSQDGFAVLQISIDSYERLAEVFGDTGSQQLASVVAERLFDLLRRSDTVSVIGNAEQAPAISKLAECKFAVALTDLDKTDSVTWIIRRIFDSLSRPIVVNDEQVYVTCSIGVSVYPDDGANAETLLRNAGVAERHARETDGTDSHVFFDEAMNESSRRQLMIEAGIRRALENDEFTLHYQPIIDLHTGRPVSAEALLRYTGESLKDIPIILLISIAEQTGLISKLGEWVLLTATRQLQQWTDDGIDLEKISVNVSATQLCNTQASQSLLRIVSEMNFAPRRLQIEITETAMMQDADAAGDTLKRLQKLGVQIALDDFGTGQSSLTYLRRFRPDVLKIDRSFVDKIDTSRTDATLVSAIIAMSHEMGLRVVAEGVEASAQMDSVRELGCDEAQGYLISKPLPAQLMAEWLRLFASQKDPTAVVEIQKDEVA